LRFLKEVRESITKTLSLLNKEDDLQNLIIKYLIYFIIGIIPKKLYSNIQYILLYANFEYNNVDKQIFENEYNIVINYIWNPTETFLISKITKEKFNQQCADAEAEINLSKINENSSYTNNSMSKRSESYYN
jgi:DNA-binding MltR family transcriptional regulator